MDIKEKIRKLPQGSGIYIMKPRTGAALYIGKATSLKKRVGSHFSKHALAKTESFLDKVTDIDFIECDSPEQALILEAALIKEKKPKYNVLLKDSKSYPYVEITKEKFPRVFVSRPKGKTDSVFFGPYPNAKLLKAALGRIREIFPYCSCKGNPKKLCLLFHINLCPAPCAGKISPTQYKANINSISKILKGQRKVLEKRLKEKMQALAREKKFEQAASLRDKLFAIENLYRGNPKVHQLISLKMILNLQHIPLIIEGVDISSLGKKDSVGSLVVFKDAVPENSSYRRFLIRKANQKDDYEMIAEVIERRYSRVIKEKGKIPDLIIVDGGSGHVNIANRALESLKLFIPIIGLAKRNEEIWFPRKKKPLIIPKDNSGLHLIQRIRDQAHRFAHDYQLVRRRKRIGL